METTRKHILTIKCLSYGETTKTNIPSDTAPIYLGEDIEGIYYSYFWLISQNDKYYLVEKYGRHESNSNNLYKTFEDWESHEFKGNSNIKFENIN